MQRSIVDGARFRVLVPIDIAPRVRSDDVMQHRTLKHARVVQTKHLSLDKREQPVRLLRRARGHLLLRGRDPPYRVADVVRDEQPAAMIDDDTDRPPIRMTIG